MAGLFAYENTTFFDLVRVDRTRSHRFGCADVLTNVVEAFRIGASDPAQADGSGGLGW